MRTADDIRRQLRGLLKLGVEPHRLAYEMRLMPSELFGWLRRGEGVLTDDSLEGLDRYLERVRAVLADGVALFRQIADEDAPH